MPGKELPSGTDFNIFLQYLRYELYLVRSLNARKLLGGSAAKEVGTHSKTLDPPTERDKVDHPSKSYQVVQQDSEEEISHKDSNNEESRDNQHEISEDKNEEVGTSAPKDNIEEVGTTAPKDKNEEVGTTAPKDFYPYPLLAIMVIGVMLNETEPVLGYI